MSNVPNTPSVHGGGDFPSAPVSDETKATLLEVSKRVRRNVIEMLCQAGSGHPGSSLSEVEIILYLYKNWMRHDPSNPSDPNRDKFVLSKGHGVPTQYAVMAECGYLPESELNSLRQLGSRLQGHPDPTRLPGIEAASGSLGQGLSIAQGMALADKMDGREATTFCMIGDGETQEGQIWECAMSAPKLGLQNLVVFTDYNKAQIDGYVHEVMPLESLAAKWAAFNWNVVEIDGHDYDQIQGALKFAKDNTDGRPTQIIAHTIKGKGVSFMENVVDWHGKAPSREQADQALEELK